MSARETSRWCINGCSAISRRVGQRVFTGRCEGLMAFASASSASEIFKDRYTRALKTPTGSDCILTAFRINGERKIVKTPRIMLTQYAWYRSGELAKRHADGARWELGLHLRRFGNKLTEPEAIDRSRILAWPKGAPQKQNRHGQYRMEKSILIIVSQHVSSSGE